MDEAWAQSGRVERAVPPAGGRPAPARKCPGPDRTDPKPRALFAIY